MAKQEQALVLDPPAELHFKAPFTDVTTSYINLTNPTDRRICFKVKTTAPKTYCVRPNSGVILPKKTVAVTVMLQPLDFENADKSRHKFMVQSIFPPEGEYSLDASLDALWRDTPPEGFMNSKLKCVFDMPAETTEGPDKVEPVKIEAKVAHVQELSPKLTPEIDPEAVIKKLMNSQKRLQSELSELRQENSTLKEEGLRSRVSSDTRSRGTSVKPTERDQHHMPPPQLVFSNSFVALSIVIFLLGLSLGKYIL